MGLDSTAVRFLIKAKQRGARFDRTLTLGRQWLILSETDAAKWLPSLTPDWPGLLRKDNFADNFLQALGARDLQVMDVSSYEDAQILHDLNDPVPQDLKGQFDAVIDGGTTEHVFNVPTAIKNCMEMVKVGGQLYAFQPSNNYCGHGFYQISPELHFRAFHADNGFRIDRILMYEWGTATLFEVNDPEDLRTRVELCRGPRPVMLLTQATRIAEVSIFNRWPQQSDYVLAWQKQAAAARRSKWSKRIPSLLLPLAQRVYRRFVISYGTLNDKRCFHRVEI